MCLDSLKSSGTVKQDSRWSEYYIIEHSSSPALLMTVQDSQIIMIYIDEIYFTRYVID